MQAHRAVVALACMASLGAQESRIQPIDLARVHELWRLTDVTGERLWPGFDARRIPIAINHRDQQEVLIHHPAPPPEFAAFEGHRIDGEPVLIRDGCTRYGPKSGGWAVDLGGHPTAYVGTLAPGRRTDDWLSLLLHECFHVYQRRCRAPTPGRLGEFPEDDPAYAALLGLESRILHAALVTAELQQSRALVQEFVAVRNARRKPLSADVIRHEGEREWSEGTAKYVEARLAMALAREVSVVPVSADPEYGAFADADQRYQAFIRSVLPPAQLPITFLHAEYQLGMAQGLLLDRLRPEWKQEMSQRGSTQFALLQRTCPVAAEDEPRLVREASARFDYDALLAVQTRLVEAKLALIRGFLADGGTRYRIWHDALPGAFQWKPEGPVYRVPASLLQTRTANPPSIWAGGIRRFERGGLVFESGAVPILFWSDRLEWIDREPPDEGRELVIESEQSEHGIHHGLRLRTRGFRLSIPSARIDRNGDVVDIRPMR